MKSGLSAKGASLSVGSSALGLEAAWVAVVALTPNGLVRYDEAVVHPRSVPVAV